jgi:hypothetical protein
MKSPVILREVVGPTPATTLAGVGSAQNDSLGTGNGSQEPRHETDLGSNRACPREVSGSGKNARPGRATMRAEPIFQECP